jgi:hypothetical protein
MISRFFKRKNSLHMFLSVYIHYIEIVHWTKRKSYDAMWSIYRVFLFYFIHITFATCNATNVMEKS